MKNKYRKHFLLIAFAILLLAFGTDITAKAQQTPVEPSAVIDELKGKLGNATEAQVNEIVEKWNAREDLAGKSKPEMMGILFQDVAAVITDVEAQNKITMSWLYEPNVNPFEDITPGCDYKVASGQPGSCPVSMRMRLMILAGADCYSATTGSGPLDKVVCELRRALLPGSATPVACVEPVSRDVTRSAGFFSFYCKTRNPEYQELQKDLQKEKVLEYIGGRLKSGLQNALSHRHQFSGVQTGKCLLPSQ